MSIPIKLYHKDVDIPNNNETEGISTYHKHFNIQHKWTMIIINSTKLKLSINKFLGNTKLKSLINVF